MNNTRSDTELISDVRGGVEVSKSFGLLYARHEQAARRHAYQISRSPFDADDLVAGAFTRLFEAMIKGGGPDGSFRAYLFTAIRHQAYDRTDSERRLRPTEDIAEVMDFSELMIPFVDPVIANWERSLVARAYSMLPERWQAVLWYIEIEGQSPGDAAPLFGLTSNSCAALASRARKGLRQAYLGLPDE